MPQPGINASRLSPNRMTRATLAATNSKEKRMLVTMRAEWPKETYAKSAKVMRELSTSKHLARSLALYRVQMTEKTKNRPPTTQPEYLKPRGRLRRPTPIKTFTELNIVCGKVDWP